MPNVLRSHVYITNERFLKKLWWGIETSVGIWNTKIWNQTNMTFISLLAIKSRGVPYTTLLGLAKNLDRDKGVSYMRVQSPLAKSKLFRLAFSSELFYQYSQRTRQQGSNQTMLHFIDELSNKLKVLWETWIKCIHHLLQNCWTYSIVTNKFACYQLYLSVE